MAVLAGALIYMDFFRARPAFVNAPAVSMPLPQGLEYDFAAVAQGAAPAPRLFLDAVPAAVLNEPDIPRRKTLFFKIVLPLVLAVNEDVLKDRKKLLALDARLGGGETLGAADLRWLNAAAERYRLDDADNADSAGNADSPDLSALLLRADAVPPSLALAQAAKESGWGRSRFAREGRALFGQWTVRPGDDGIVPEDRAHGARHRVKAFKNLRASVRAYVQNLNTHNAYREFRKIRAQLRAAGNPLSGPALAQALERYSELGVEYTERIKAMIGANGLAALDSARLTPPLTPSWAPAPGG